MSRKTCWNKSRILITLLFLLFSSSILSANPFLGREEKPGPDAPRRSGFAQGEKMRQLQENLSEKISSLFKTMQEDPTPAAWLILMGSAFLYGLLHAAGPGHRKTVVFSLFLGRDSRWWEPAAAGLLSGLLHAGSGVVLVLILAAVSKRFLSNRVYDTALYLEGGTYFLLLLTALLLLIWKISTSGRESKEKQERSGGIYGIITASSLFPCPIAIMLILYSVALQQTMLGITAVSVLSLGMGLTISAAAYLAYTGRRKLFDVLKKHEKNIRKLTNILEAGAYGFLFLFSLWMGYPFFSSVVRLLIQT